MTCQLCGKWGQTEKRHVFQAFNRNNSEKYGAYIFICRDCHNAIHHHPKRYEWLKEYFQKQLMTENGWSTEEWLKIFRRNYL